MVFASNNATANQTNNVSVYGEDDLIEANITKLQKSDAYVMVSGEITFENTIGFLNAE